MTTVPWATPVSDTNRWYIGVNDDYIYAESYDNYEDAVEAAKFLVNEVDTWKLDIEEQDTDGLIVRVDVFYEESEALPRSIMS